MESYSIGGNTTHGVEHPVLKRIHLPKQKELYRTCISATRDTCSSTEENDGPASRQPVDGKPELLLRKNSLFHGKFVHACFQRNPEALLQTCNKTPWLPSGKIVDNRMYTIGLKRQFLNSKRVLRRA